MSVAAVESTLEAAAARVDYRLTFGCTEEPRRCHSRGIEGPEIPDVHYVVTADPDAEPIQWGDWLTTWGLGGDTDADRITSWFAAALDEGVHEVLEWFHVDGAQLLDPHGKHEAAIHTLVNQLAHELAALASPIDTEVIR